MSDEMTPPRSPSPGHPSPGGNGTAPHRATRIERDEAPAYLARWQERRAAGASHADAVRDREQDGDGPLYLRRFRERADDAPTTDSLPPLWERSGAGMQRAMSEDNRNKEIAAPAAARSDVIGDVYLVRHGETQGYSTESGLTPLGSWQAHTWGHTLGKRVKDGERIVVANAATNRAGQTAQQLHNGLLDALELFEKDVEVVAPTAMAEFRNFQVATPDGLRDVTGAFRQYYAQIEALERVALGDRPLWLVEVDRFWQTQQAGGDPIQHWLTIPMMHFEPPAMCVRRFWSGILQLVTANPGARLAVATHSGPIRAFAIAALGYDPGEPYNTEHVRIKVFDDGVSAMVSYRNRAQRIRIPDVVTLPSWQVGEDWQGYPAPPMPAPSVPAHTEPALAQAIHTESALPGRAG